MKFSDLVAVSNMPGLYLMNRKRTDGLILKFLDSDKTTFASSRKHVFTPLENITIYTEEDHVSLLSIFQTIKSKKLSYDIKSDESLGKAFEIALPNYDKSRVYKSDIKKIFKWYDLLVPFDQAHQIFIEEVEEAPKTTKELKPTEEIEEVIAPKPKATAKKTAKKNTIEEPQASEKSVEKKPKTTAKKTAKKTKDDK
ncbi:MAG: hypothetical protein MUE53_07935 [Chitinophagales bacterium]|jgi:hypothetical protein|nr:hypothetical protein [Chitinophagales bacterium]